MAAEQRRGRVIIRSVLRSAVRIGIAIKAAAAAAVVGTDVDALDAAAGRALPLVLD